MGEVPGEYCPGRYSVNARGAAKLAGIGQRVVGGGSHTGVVLVVEGEGRINDGARAGVRALGLDWKPERRRARSDDGERPGRAGTRCATRWSREYAGDYELVEGELDVRRDAGARRASWRPRAPPAHQTARRRRPRRVRPPRASDASVGHSSRGMSWPIPGIVIRLGAGDRPGGRDAGAERDERVVLAVDHHGRHVELPQRRGPRAGGHDRRRAGAPVPGGVVAAVVGRGGQLAHALLVHAGSAGEPIIRNTRTKYSM